MSGNQPQGPRAAAFFDVDGTIVRSTIVHYYMYFRGRRMSPFVHHIWRAAFLAKCGYYLVLDRLSRSRLNTVFYRSYRGLPVNDIKALAGDCFREVIEAQCFPCARNCVTEHHRAGREVVLATGSIDFIVAPLARKLGVQKVVAAALVESDGLFTGQLDGPPIGEWEKARRIREFAGMNGIDLAQSYAYGDSIADLPMLECVGFPHAVNPDKKLAATARKRGWPIRRWTLAGSRGGNGRW